MDRGPRWQWCGGGRHWKAVAAAVLLLTLALRVAPAGAESDEDRRAQAGIRLFRSLLAAELNLEQKVDRDGKLLLLVFHTGDRARADELERTLAGEVAGEPDPIHGLPVRLDTTIDPSFAAFATSPPAGIFVGQAPPAGVLQAIVRYGISHHVVIYSPFEGHVEQGVLAGLSVEAQVRPYVNRDTLVASHIVLKSFFLKVAKIYP